MDLHVLTAVALIWSVAAITPGPNFFLTLHTAIDTTPKLSLSTVAGIVTGTFIWAVSGYLGIALVFKTVPVLYFLMKTTGGLYLIYLGINLIFRKKAHVEKEMNRHSSLLGCFRLGLLTNLLNPKTAAFMSSLFAAAIPQKASFDLGILIVLVICSISACWYSLVSLAFSNNTARRVYEKQKGKIQKMAGAIFVVFGSKLAASE